MIPELFQEKASQAANLTKRTRILEVSDRMRDTNMTVYRAILDANRDRLGTPALLAGGKKVSYAELPV